jgi:hypothetical protein
LSYQHETKRISEISEGAILGGLTALVYTMQLIFGIGTAISYLSLIPLVYSGKKSISEWTKVVVVSSIFIFTFNDIGGALFFILFMVPVSFSLILRLNGEYLSIAVSPILLSLILILTEFSWIVGFKIPQFLGDFWIVLAFIFCLFVVEIFSKVIFNILEKFKDDFGEKIDLPKFLILLIDLGGITLVYKFSLLTLLNFGSILVILFFEIFYSMLRNEINRVFQKILQYMHEIIR